MLPSESASEAPRSTGSEKIMILIEAPGCQPDELMFSTPPWGTLMRSNQTVGPVPYWAFAPDATRAGAANAIIATRTKQCPLRRSSPSVCLLDRRASRQL
ncbi:MAG: hypothetical protein R2690_07325 [Acidimicrobiales bacterium]